MCYRPQVTPAPNRGRRTVAFGANVSETGVAPVRAPRGSGSGSCGVLGRGRARATCTHPPLSLSVSFPGRHVQPRARDSAPVAHGRARGSYNVASHTRLPALLQRTGGPFMPRVVGNMVWTGRAANRRRYKPEARSLRIPSRGPRRGPSSPVADRRPPPSSAWGRLAESSPITCSLHLSGTAQTRGELGKLGTNLLRATVC